MARDLCFGSGENYVLTSHAIPGNEVTRLRFTIFLRHSCQVASAFFHSHESYSLKVVGDKYSIKNGIDAVIC